MILFYAIALILVAALSGWLMTRDGNTYKFGEGIGGLTLLGYVHFMFTYREYGFWLVVIPAILGLLAFVACRLADKRDDWALQRRQRPVPQGPVRHDFTVSGYECRSNKDDFTIV